MSTRSRYRLIGSPSADDEFKTEQTRDLSGGVNTQFDPQDLTANQAVVLNNLDIGIKGKRIARPGLTLLQDIGSSITFASEFDPDGGTPHLDIIRVSGSDTALWTWDTSSAIVPISGTVNMITSGAVAFKAFKTGGDGDVRLFGSQTKNWIEVKQDLTVTDLGDTSDTGADSPPRSNVGTFYNSRVWVLKDNLLYYSDAIPDSYADTFDTRSIGHSYNMSVGDERFIIGVRGRLVAGGKDLIRYVVPSDTPDPTDESGILVNDGCQAGRTAVLVGDDILYLSRDGVRGVFRTEFDTLQYKTSLPLSFPLKDEFDIINWAHIDKSHAIHYDNKYFIALPTSSSTYCNKVWVYYPASNGWMIINGWNVSGFAKILVNGKEYLYATDATDGKVYRAWSGSSDNGTDFEISETSRKYDAGTTFENKTGGEVFLRLRATGVYDVNVYASFDDGEFNKIGELNTLDRTTNFTAWTLPMIFLGEGLYAKKFHIDRYGKWYQMQIKLDCEDSHGGDLTIIETSLITKLDKYFSEEK